METPASEVAGIAEQLIGQGMQFLTEKQKGRKP